MKKIIKGVTKGYEYTMKIVYAHFPINVSVEKNRVVIKNFCGEKTPRYADIVDNVNVEIKGQEVFVRGIDSEAIGQTCANIEQALAVRKKDLRVFQDGIYLVSRGE
jgi:large subunit ribosomal protein L6